jgi:hypothetical protein
MQLVRCVYEGDGCDYGGVDGMGERRELAGSWLEVGVR